MPRVASRQQLAELDAALLELLDEAAALVAPTTQAFLDADVLALSRLPESRDRLDSRATSLEEACYLLLVRQQPVAGDLRHVVAVLRSLQDLQRVSNLLCHIGASVRWVHPPALNAQLRTHIARLGEVTADILASAAGAWRERDALAASELARTDDEVDAQQTYLLTDLYTGDHRTEDAVSLALVARYYERLGDHGVEIARQLAYFIAGTRPSDPPSASHDVPAP